MKNVFSALALAALTSAAFAVPFTANFETDQSASFVTTVAGTTGESNANWTYSSASHTQTTGAPVTIGSAPGSATTNVLRLNANVSGATDVDAISVYPNVTGLGANWIMTFDAWQNYTGDAGGAGGTGSTNGIIIGATSATTVAPRLQTTSTVAGDGFYFGMIGEGGATTDHRYYAGTTTVAANNNGALWFGGAAGTNLNAADTAWTTFFPTPTYQTAGAAGKAWVTYKLAVTGTNAVLSIKRVGDSSFTDVATNVAAVPATSTKPFIGFSDINTAVASPVADQFLLIDNLTVDNAPSAVENWEMF